MHTPTATPLPSTDPTGRSRAIAEAERDAAWARQSAYARIYNTAVMDGDGDLAEFAERAHVEAMREAGELSRKVVVLCARTATRRLEVAS